MKTYQRKSTSNAQRSTSGEVSEITSVLQERRVTLQLKYPPSIRTRHQNSTIRTHGGSTRTVKQPKQLRLNFQSVIPKLELSQQEQERRQSAELISQLQPKEVPLTFPIVSEHVGQMVRLPDYKGQQRMLTVINGKYATTHSMNLRVRQSLQDVMLRIQSDLGSVELDDARLQKCQFYVCTTLKTQQVIACLIVEQLKGKRVSFMDAETEFVGDECQAACGISRVWTLASHRRQGVAKQMIQCCLNKFQIGQQFTVDQLAFSQPTQGGIRLATNVTASKTLKIYTE